MADSSNTSLRSEPAPILDNAPAPSSSNDPTSSSAGSTANSTSSATTATEGADNFATGSDVKNEDPVNTAAGATDDKALAKSSTAGKGKKRYCTHRKQAMMEAEKEAKEKAEKEKAEAEKKEKEKAEAEKKEKEKAEAEKKEKDDADKADSSSSSDEKKKKKKASKKKKHRSKRKSHDSDSGSESGDSTESESSSSSDSDSSSESDADEELLRAVLKVMLKSKAKARKSKKARKAKKKAKKAAEEAAAEEAAAEEAEEADKEPSEEEKKEGSEPGELEFKRVDELYDKELHDWTIKDTVPNPTADNYSSFAFTVRRCFDYDGRYTNTVLDIKSPLLKDALHDVMGHVRGVSLVEEEPVIDPRTVFIYEEQLRKWLETNPSDRKDKKPRRDAVTHQPLPDFTEEELKTQKGQVNLLLSYLETDFRTTRSQLYPLLENQSITYDLLWAILKPDTVMYTTCAGSNEPRAFRLEYAEENSSFTRGKWWAVEGRYLEYEGVDGRQEEQKSPNQGFGWGTVRVDIDAFKGPRKIQSLACYPLEMRKDCEELRTKLIERGKKFVELRGQQYKMHNGLAFMKKNRQYLKVHINGRIMIDSATFRRVNPNYIVSSVKSRDNDDEDDDEANYFYLDPEDDPDNDSACDDCCCGDDEEKAADTAEREMKKMRWIKDDDGNWQLATKGDILAGKNKLDTNVEAFNAESDDDKNATPVFGDDDYLIAAPVVLGWAFSDKLWLEFPVCQISDIVWNDKAFDQLVLPSDQKDIVRALVESHSTSGSTTIDDVIAGKGRGLVSVLHGPPGVGKTMTCEAIAEFLRRPLYCVSSGELGTNPSQLEHELQKILDIAHGWGAVLLLDEADVFLEKRSFADMHRNALVSIFLRLLEYFQGILFLTTNRVETFDDAFQSRIHVALRYGDLGLNAKISIWKMFIDKVYAAELANTSSSPTPSSSPATDTSAESSLPRLVTYNDIDWLAKKDLNGRQIKNVVRTAQALAKSKGERMGIAHLRKVLTVAEGFEDDLKGTGRLQNMHAYA